MTEPFLSVIIPAYNEQARIAETVAKLEAHLSSKTYEWEIIVADDGSGDRTVEIVGGISKKNAHVRLLPLEHRGKGWAIKNGMLHAKGQWRFMCDADLSMAVEQIDRFLPGDAAPPFDIGIGSREAPGARRFGEPLLRHLIGRVYNWNVRLLAVRGLNDTQCGFKLFRGQLVPQLFGRQTLVGLGFDVEVLFLARKTGARIQEVPIDWQYRTGSKVGLLRSARRLLHQASGFLDIVRVRSNAVLGRYESD